MSWKTVTVLFIITFVAISICFTNAQNVPLKKFQKYAKDLKKQWFGSQGNAYLLLAYMDDVSYPRQKFDVSNRDHFCGEPQIVLRSKPVQSQEDQSKWRDVGYWRWIADNRLGKEDYFERSKRADGMSFPVNDNLITALWSDKCVMTRYSILKDKTGRNVNYSPHYEEVLAYYMKYYNDRVYRKAGRNPKLISYSSKPPCDLYSRGKRHCSDLVLAIREGRRPYFSSIYYPSSLIRDWLYFTEGILAIFISTSLSFEVKPRLI